MTPETTTPTRTRKPRTPKAPAGGPHVVAVHPALEPDAEILASILAGLHTLPLALEPGMWNGQKVVMVSLFAEPGRPPVGPVALLLNPALAALVARETVGAAAAPLHTGQYL